MFGLLGPFQTMIVYALKSSKNGHRIAKQFSRDYRFRSYDGNRHIQESPHPRAPKSQKSLKTVFPGLPARSVKKVSKKSPNTDFAVFLTRFRVFWDFSTLFRHSGRGAREDRFETFLGFRGSGVWRLLYMAAPIVIPVAKILSPVARQAPTKYRKNAHCDVQSVSYTWSTCLQCHVASPAM